MTQLSELIKEMEEQALVTKTFMQRVPEDQFE